MNSELDNGIILPLMESFYSIQGEGFFAGNAAYFLRIGGCDVGCHWCDVKESWDPDIHALTKVDDIMKGILGSQANTVVITGGEPLSWNMEYLTNSIQKQGLKTNLETSGAYKLTGNWDWICLSPKKFQPPLDTIKPLVNELKVIVRNKYDFKWAEEQRKGLNRHSKLYLQPEWSNREKITPLIIDYVMKYPAWQISIQKHKYLQIP